MRQRQDVDQSLYLAWILVSFKKLNNDGTRERERERETGGKNEEEEINDRQVYML